MTKGSKTINKVLCDKFTFELNYKKKLVERTNECDRTIQNGLTGSSSAQPENDIKKKVYLWVDPLKKQEFRLVRSLIQILQGELTPLAQIQKIINDIGLKTKEIGWPLRLEFSPKKHVTITMDAKPIVDLGTNPVIPNTDCKYLPKNYRDLFVIPQ